jgi:ADP-heptose:LPS heptosyltransferase
VAALCQKHGHSVCCVGHPRYSYCPDGVEDLRSEDLETSITAISSARLLAGELSGPMHLAQLCGVPLVIWADGQWRLDNCERWNVFHVPTFIVANDTHRPDADRVVTEIDGALQDLRRRTDNFTKPCHPHP